MTPLKSNQRCPDAKTFRQVIMEFLPQTEYHLNLMPCSTEVEYPDPEGLPIEHASIPRLFRVRIWSGRIWISHIPYCRYNSSSWMVSVKLPMVGGGTWQPSSTSADLVSVWYGAMNIAIDWYTPRDGWDPPCNDPYGMLEQYQFFCDPEPRKR